MLPTQDAARPAVTKAGLRGVGALLRLPLYRRVVLVAALILGSHAMHDSFAVIRWGAAGIGPSTAGLLWSLSVAAEVVVFLFVGRPLLDRVGPVGAAMLAAAAGIVRWAVMAETAWLPALVAIQPLHGLTFALLHLTCMRLLAECIPRHLAATALTLYGTVGIGTAATLLTLASGPLYARFGAHGFWIMAALCAAALPLARTLREPTSEPT
jgi:PPP family 3-phenylpropionic acid transporter